MLGVDRKPATSGNADPFGLNGSVIDGQFRVDQWIGEGGFSVVYKGFHLGLQEPIAIKCLKMPQIISEQSKEVVDQFTNRFRDESRIAYRLSQGNLHIVRSITSGSTTASNGMLVPYMVLEWLEGLTLATDLRKRRDARMSGRALDEVVRIFAPAAEALAYAHAHGVVHRDVKPGNLYLAQTREGYRLKVLDFGMAKILSDGSIGMSQLAKSVGTVQVFSVPYAAPEQFDTKLGAIGTWTDVYSLALVILEALADRRVRTGDGLAECLIQACDPLKVPSPRSMGLQVPDHIEDIFKRALAPKPTDRPQDVGEFWGQLRNAMLRDADKKADPEYADMDSLPPDSLDNHDDPATIVADTSGMFDNQTSPSAQAPGAGRPAAGRAPDPSLSDDEEPTRTVDLNATFPMGPGGQSMPTEVKDYLAQRAPAAGTPPPAAGSPALRVPRPFGNGSPASGRHPNAGAPIPEPLDFGAPTPNEDGPSSDPPTMAMASPAVEVPPHGAVPGGMSAAGMNANTAPQPFFPQSGAAYNPAPPAAPAGLGMTLPLNAAFPGGFPGQPAQGAPGGGGQMNAQYNPGASANFAAQQGHAQAQQGHAQPQAYNPQASVPGAMPPGGMQQGAMQGMPQQGGQQGGAPGQGGMPQGGGMQGAMPAPMPMPMQSGYAASSAQPGGVWGGSQQATVIRAAPEKSKGSIFAVVGLVALFVLSVGGYLTYSFFAARSAVKHEAELAAATKAKQDQAAAAAASASASANEAMVPPIVTPSGTVFPAVTATADTTATAEPTTTAAPTATAPTAATTTTTTTPTPTPTSARTAAATNTAPTPMPTPLAATGTATSTRPTPLPTPTAATTASAPAEPGRFSPEAAQKSLRAMEGILASCKRPEGPNGAGHVRVTFGNDGSVMSSVIIGAPFDGTPVGDCAASRFKMARVPKFEGPPGVTDYTFHINK